MKPRTDPADLSGPMPLASTVRHDLDASLQGPTLTAFTAGLRAKLLLLVALAVVPAIGLIAYSAFNERQQAAINAETSALNLVQLIASEQSRMIATSKQLLLSMTLLQETKTPRTAEACNGVLSELVKAYPYYTSIGVATLDGNVWCSSRALPGKVNVGDRVYFKRTVESRDFSVGTYIFGRVTGVHALNMGYPVMVGDKLVGVMYVGINLNWVGQMISDIKLPSNSVLLVVDDEGTVLAHYPDTGGAVGKTMRASPLTSAMLHSRQEGMAEVMDNDGVARFFAFAPLHDTPGGNVYVAVGISKGAVFAAADETFTRNLYLLIAVALLVMAAAWIGSEMFVLRRMRHLESELQQRTEEADRASKDKSRFFAAASHDLRQPLHALSLLLGSLDLNVKQKNARPALTQMKTALGSLELLLEGVLNISALEAGNMAPHVEPVATQALFTILEREFRPVAESKGLALRFRVTNAVLETDALWMERILRNLISNAVKYTQSGDILVTCRILRSRGIAKIQVFDTGIGIAADELDYIFEDFYQVVLPASGQRQPREGIGLGLGIVKRLANILGHSIEVRSRPGRGSVFTLSAPLSERQSAASLRDTVSNDKLRLPLTGHSILVVDDHEMTIYAISTLLLNWDARVVTAASKAELQQVLAALTKAPDFLIVDYQFEPSFTGEDVIRQVREHFHQVVPCAMMTGNLLLIPPHVSQLPRVSIFAKPVSPAKLRAILHFNLVLRRADEQVQ